MRESGAKKKGIERLKTNCMILKLISVKWEIYFSYFLLMVQVSTIEENNMASVALTKLILRTWRHINVE